MSRWHIELRGFAAATMVTFLASGSGQMPHVRADQIGWTQYALVGAIGAVWPGLALGALTGMAVPLLFTEAPK